MALRHCERQFSQSEAKKKAAIFGLNDNDVSLSACARLLLILSLQVPSELCSAAISFSNDTRIIGFSHVNRNVIKVFVVLRKLAI